MLASTIASPALRRASREHDELATVRRTYSLDEAAATLWISRTTAYECVKTNELAALRFRGRIVISTAVIDACRLAGVMWSRVRESNP